MSEKRQRTVLTAVRMSPEEHRRIAAAASAKGVSVGRFLRDAASVRAALDARMSAIGGRIAEVTELVFRDECGLDKDGYDDLDLAQMAFLVAEAVVAELGLREIRTTGALVGDMLHMTYDGTASPHRYYRTPWEPAS